MSKNTYDDNFYRDREKQTAYAAQRVLKIVLENMGKEQVKSAVDIGCGVGTWLNQIHFMCKTDDVWGYDGDYVNKEYLMIPREHFRPCNLEERIISDRRYDIAISLEVAEHLTPDRAKSFVEDLCSLADTVLFSAATVFQGGTEHKNEQRLNYWIEKFRVFGYEPSDVIRPVIWDDKRIPVWYRQNIILFRKTSKDRSEYEHVSDLIHPDLYEEKLGIMHHYKNKLLFKIYFGVRAVVIFAGRKLKRLIKQ